MAKPRLKAVILAGGLGTRLRPYTYFLPKPMLPLGDKPILEHLINWLRDNGVMEILISVEYLRRVIEDYFREGEELGVKLTFVKSERPMGTAGQLKVTEGFIDRTFLCVNGDSLFDFKIDDAVKFHRERGALATILVTPFKTSLRYGFIEVDYEGALRDWREKPEFRGLINIGFYVMEPSFLKYIPKGTVCGMDSAFRQALNANERICGYVVSGDFIHIGDRRSYTRAYKKYLGRLGEIP